jgi:hypothetical protein
VQMILLGVVGAYQKCCRWSLGSARRRAEMLQPGGSEREENGAGERGEGGGFIGAGRRRLRQGGKEN